MSHLWIVLAAITVSLHFVTAPGADTEKQPSDPKKSSTSNTEKRGLGQTIKHYYNVAVKWLKYIYRKAGEILHILTPKSSTDSSKSSTNSAKSSTDSPKSSTDSPKSSTDSPKSSTDSTKKAEGESTTT